MIKNYYEILEVNIKASREIIEKAYKTLIKKYHPDLYQGEKRVYAEKKVKEINEAYKILSDEFLREQYNAELQRQIEYENERRYKRVYSKEDNKTILTTAKENEESDYQVGGFSGLVYLAKQLFRNKPKMQDMKNLQREDFIAAGITLVIVIVLGIILWFVPATNSFIRSLIPW